MKLAGLEVETVAVLWSALSLFATGAAYLAAGACSCGYMTPHSLPGTLGAMVFAWLPFCIRAKKCLTARAFTIVTVVLPTWLFVRNLLDVLWFSPHAPFSDWWRNLLK